ncbi:MAG: hypothetical protein ACRDNS_06370 [Trebonia sp.]
MPGGIQGLLEGAAETSAHGQHTIWLVTDRQPGTRISYARVTPGDQAGTVTVTIRPAGHHSEAEVTYHLTALADPASRKLREFADGYPAYLQSWQDSITAWLHHADNHAPLSWLPGRIAHLPGNQPIEGCLTIPKLPAHSVQVHVIPHREPKYQAASRTANTLGFPANTPQ